MLRSALEGFVLCCLGMAGGRMLPHLACADGLPLGHPWLRPFPECFEDGARMSPWPVLVSGGSRLISGVAAAALMG